MSTTSKDESKGSVQDLLRFLTADAKLPLTSAMGCVAALKKAGLDGPTQIAASTPTELGRIFSDEKQAKSVLAAAKRVNKKRTASSADDAPPPTPTKKSRTTTSAAGKEQSPAELEASLSLPALPVPLNDADLRKVTMVTNRAPLVLAFVVVLLKYTMPEQPLSSRLSLGQAFVSITSRARAVNLGIETGSKKSASEEGWGEGLHSVKVWGKEVSVLRRWGYVVSPSEGAGEKDGDGEERGEEHGEENDSAVMNSQEPPLWGLDLEHQRSSSNKHTNGSDSALPIYTPQSARAYLLKSFASPPSDGENAPQGANKKKSNPAHEKEQNLALLLQALEMLFNSWAPNVENTELERRAWAWYLKVRPAVQEGKAGWGERSALKLGEILDLRSS